MPIGLSVAFLRSMKRHRRQHLCRVSQASGRVRVHGVSSLQDCIQVAADGRLQRLQHPTPLCLQCDNLCLSIATKTSCAPSSGIRGTAEMLCDSASRDSSRVTTN